MEERLKNMVAIREKNAKLELIQEKSSLKYLENAYVNKKMY